ncbi:mannitol dehydrogenase family protein [Aurantiacibacter suaedae]|uniref:mannitol dehydrogenase family protein n=1 Tax=Aurantiacibacter suaedae TaxID=2545755 RepID=UPI001F4F14C7|nr:mannitol dehydrogenase family protein [Aurantiacibacter suaedae]
MRLSAENAGQLPGDVSRPGYDRGQPVGIVHFGIGAFHRAHQAAFTDACMEGGEPGWMIAGVSMRSAAVAEQLNPQDGLYTLTVRSAGESRTRLVGSVAQVLVAGSDREEIVACLASPDCHVASFTVTEKGYCRKPDGSLDLAKAKDGFYPILSDALVMRRDAGLPGLSLLSCDNLSGNGKQLRRLMLEWIDDNAADLRDWFLGNCTTPDSMVDRIVPASSGADLDGLEQRIGMRDEGAVFTEAFTQWVIEDDFAGLRPSWEDHGVQIVSDVAPFETAKLRMLNGAHSLLAYAGQDRGHTFVHEAIADDQLRHLVQRLMIEEAAPTIAAGDGQDLEAYAGDLVARFENPALNHRLAQIAMDGSQKIGQRWLETLTIQQQRGNSCEAILTAIAHWLNHISGDAREVEDPQADALREVWQRAGHDGIVQAIFGTGGPLQSDWTPSQSDMAYINAKLQSLR